MSSTTPNVPSGNNPQPIMRPAVQAPATGRLNAKAQKQANRQQGGAGGVQPQAQAKQPLPSPANQSQK